MDKLQKLLAEKLAGVVDETFENMAFIGTEEINEEQLPTDTDSMREVRLLITAPVVMEIHLKLSDELLRQIVETMYTIDFDEITEEQIVDVLAETLNTIGGCLMTELLPADQSFSLSLPEIVTEDAPYPDDNVIFTSFYLADSLPMNIKICAATTEELEAMIKL